jgi:hypothetical protein
MSTFPREFALINFAIRARTSDVSDRDTFKSVLSDGVALTGVPLEGLAKALRTSQGSVSRWIHGYSAPADSIRRLAVNFLADLARGQAIQSACDDIARENSDQPEVKP